jgi:hypothetical protein
MTKHLYLVTGSGRMVYLGEANSHAQLDLDHGTSLVAWDSRRDRNDNESGNAITYDKWENHAHVGRGMTILALAAMLPDKALRP